ncbi:MAG: putative lipid II flippase FtsW [Treponema sp.]|jgi:cell division protein FtsW|nr:putative lipid II flippase FtsW [Treponema sp.]
MYQFEAEASEYRSRGNQALIASVFLLTGLGLVILYSASYGFGLISKEDGLYFISRQLKPALAGLALFFIASKIKLELLRKVMIPLVIGALVLCLLTFFPGIGVTKNGASRWIGIGGLEYQPSELVKLALPLYLAHIFDKKQDSIGFFTSGVLPPVLITSLFFLIIYRQNNLSTAVFIAVNALVIFFLAGVKLRYFFFAIVMMLPLTSLMVLTKEHRLRRVISFFWPNWEPQGAGYQVRSSLLTIMSGGVLGKGLGQGTRKIASVPEVHSDFIFSAFAEESGFIGVFLLFALFAFFAWQGYRAGYRAATVYRRLLAYGLVTMIVSQALLNMAVVSGSLPATGIPLPFFSHGGSSLMTTLLMAGLVVNVSRRNPALARTENLSQYAREIRRQPLYYQDVEGELRLNARENVNVR